MIIRSVVEAATGDLREFIRVYRVPSLNGLPRAGDHIQVDSKLVTLKGGKEAIKIGLWLGHTMPV